MIYKIFVKFVDIQVVGFATKMLQARRITLIQKCLSRQELEYRNKRPSLNYLRYKKKIIYIYIFNNYSPKAK
mgnify:CR=1 FL=1